MTGTVFVVGSESTSFDSAQDERGAVWISRLSCTTTIPVIMTDSYAENGTETVMINVTTTIPVMMTIAYNNNDTETQITKKPAEIVPTNYDRSLAQLIHLMWEIGYNQTQTAYIFAGRNYPVVALCNEPNTKISLLNDKGRIIDSWLCQKKDDRLTILKPEYRNGDVYVFEAAPEYSLTRRWKSSLSVNIRSVHHYISQANPSYNPPALALLISMYLLTGSAF